MRKTKSRRLKNILHCELFSGIVLLDGITNDLMESKAIKYAIDKVDIYSGSWGPQDNGVALDGPGHLSSLALQYGATKVGQPILKFDQSGSNSLLKTYFPVTVKPMYQN